MAILTGFPPAGTISTYCGFGERPVHEEVKMDCKVLMPDKMQVSECAEIVDPGLEFYIGKDGKFYLGDPEGSNNGSDISDRS